jgi:uncharacterized protein (DUF362 family)
MNPTSHDSKIISNKQKNQSIVSRVLASDDLRASIETAVNLVGGFQQIIKPGDTVMIKPNLNTSDPFPASSDPQFIKALGEAILDAGAKKLRIIDSSTLRVSTRKVAEEIGLTPIAEELNAELIFLDEHPWVKQKFPRAKYLKKGSIGEAALERGKLVLAPCLKTHRFARFTASMKLFLGLLKRQDRLKMHLRKLEYKIADLASFFQPSLIVMDARKCFVTNGPTSGQIETPNLIMASHDIVAIDVVGVRILQSFNANNRLDRPVWELPQIKHAVTLGLGASKDEEIHVIEPAN